MRLCAKDVPKNTDNNLFNSGNKLKSWKLLKIGYPLLKLFVRESNKCLKEKDRFCNLPYERDLIGSPTEETQI